MCRISRSLAAALVVFTTFTVADRARAAAPPFSSLPKSAESFDVGTLHIDKFGSGAQQPLILIPGLGGGAWVWQDTIASFSPEHALYVITLPGFDGRPPTNEKPLFDAFKRDFWAILGTHKIAKPVVIGHSLGGTLAIALAEQHPEQLAGIVAVDGLPVFPTLATATPEQRETMATQFAGRYESFSPAESFQSQLAFMRAMGTNKPELAEPAARLQARSDPKAIAAWVREDLLVDLRPDLGKITIPLIEITPHDSRDAQQMPGAPTQEQTLALYISLFTGAPKATVVPITPSRHFVMLDQPEAFHKAVKEFLDSVRR